jgi:hypothetical protein
LLALINSSRLTLPRRIATPERVLQEKEEIRLGV